MAGVLDSIKRDLAARLRRAALEAEAAGELPGAPASVPAGEWPPLPVLDVPRERGHGDLASNLALTMAGILNRSPRRVGQALLDHLELQGSLADRVELAGPGFLNFFLSPRWLYRVLEEVQRLGPKYGASNLGGGRRIQVEFVSANPTGPLVVVNARAAAVEDALANLLQAVGFEVEREYYINDAGHQVELLARSLEARLRELLGQTAEVPEEGYPGEYLRDLASDLLQRRGREAVDALLALEPGQRWEVLGREAVAELVAQQRRTLEDYGVQFDVWFSERELRARGVLEEALGVLERRGYTYRHEGALWFRSTALGDDKDRVLIRSGGEPTYLATDIAYHLDKYRRGFHRVIDIWGPDHHGYIARMKSAVEALGQGRDALEVLIVQLVRLLRGGEAVRMSKRGGEFVTMDELVAEVGKDAARFFFLMRSPDSHLDFDLDLARLQSADNPVYYVQYAHARICSIFGRGGPQVPPADRADLSLLRDESELDLMRHLGYFPQEVAGAALGREPHRITRYLLELAGLFHAFYTRCRVLSEDPGLTAARLVLTQAVQTVLRNGLGLLGVEAPEHM
ncbi:MAG: arginine--tRNA ligase [Acetobacteraceae bacterium]|nr:arginine--tRNA ligase [Acetobacteraceae bacterium]